MAEKNLKTDGITILGIESSCDETSAAVVVDGKKILSCIVASQIDKHAKFKGVVPEIASRAHLEVINSVVDNALERCKIDFSQLDAIAAVNMPGLVGSLLIGLTTAKTYAWALEKKFIAVNHVHAHAYGALMGTNNPEQCFPAIALLVSGGHTSIFFCDGPTRMKLLGATQDDAAGEAFDKVASILGLGYPGGPAIDRIAKKGNPEAIRFKRTWLKKDSFDFSFSGIKTAVLYYVRGNDLSKPDSSHLTDKEIADIAASFQASVVEVLVEKAILACKSHNISRLIVGGGVAANSYLRDKLFIRTQEEGIELIIAPFELCTDNAAMVAGLAYHKYRNGEFAGLDCSVKSTGL